MRIIYRLATVPFIAMLAPQIATACSGQFGALQMCGSVFGGLPGPITYAPVATSGSASDITSGTLNANRLPSALNDFAITPTQSLSVSPTGNPTTGPLLTTYSSFSVQGTTAKSGNREFLVNLGLTSTLGSGAINNNDDKVTLYSGIDRKSVV